MSNAYGPFTLPNPATPLAPTIQSYNFPPNTRYIRFINDSVYDLGIRLGGSSPSTPAVMGGEYTDVCPADSRLTIDLRDANLTGSDVMGGTSYYWDGNVYVAVYNNAGLLETSYYSTRRRLWIVTYSDGETPPADNPAPRTVDTGFQQRVIALPVTPQGIQGGQFTPTAAGVTQVLGTFDGTHNNVPFLMHAIALSSSVTGSMWFTVQLTVVNPGATVSVTKATICSLNVTGPFSFALPLAAPLYVLCTPQAIGELDTIRISFVLVSGTAFAVTSFMIYDLALNPSNSGPVPGPGLAPVVGNNPIW